MSDMESLESSLMAEIGAAPDEQSIEAVRVSAFGKKGSVSELLKSLGSMSPAERQSKGAAINGLKSRVSEALAARRAELRDAAVAARLAAERVDVTLPVRQSPAERGRIHPISQVTDEITAIFADMGFSIAEGRTVAPGAEPSVYYRGVSPGFFAAFGVPLLRGREFTAADRLAQPHVAIVNDAFARQHYPGHDPIGRRVRWTSGDAHDWITIVGVAADAKGLGLDVDEVPAVYGPFMQDGAVWRRYMDFAVRTTGDPAALGPAVRRAVASVDPSVPVMRLRTMNDLIATSVTDRRLVLLLLTIFSVAALTLSGVGLYGTMAYAVRSRTAEIGVRLALGSTPAAAVRLVLREAWWCVAIGLGIGVALAFASVNLIRSLLFQIAPTDALTYVLALSGIGAVALGAAFVPAARAARIDPLIVLQRV